VWRPEVIEHAPADDPVVAVDLVGFAVDKRNVWVTQEWLDQQVVLV
jgi:hypothetical protein